MHKETWKTFLKGYSNELVTCEDAISNPPVEDSVVSSGWLGFPPATENEINKKEEELGTTFPPSLRSFYLVTNGWRTLGFHVYELVPVQEVGFLKDLDPVFWEFACKIEASDKNSLSYRFECGTQIKRSLVISGRFQEGYVLLDPTPKKFGEWPVGFYKPWDSSPKWWMDSFESFMKDQYESFLQLK